MSDPEDNVPIVESDLEEAQTGACGGDIARPISPNSDYLCPAP
jgi:hypothetical protein